MIPLLLATAVLAADPVIPEPVAQVQRQPEPTWRTQMMTAGDGSNAVVYFEPKGETQVPAKLVQQFPDGRMKMTVDLHPEGSEVDDAGQVQFKYHGMQVGYHPSGAVAQVAYYDQGKMHGPVRTFFENGQPEKMFGMSHGELHGPWERYDEAGNLVEEALHRDGKLVGPAMAYHEGGARASEMPYEEGLREGSALAWHESGELAGIRRFKADKLHGTDDEPAVISYFEDGTVAERQNFIEGEPVGLHELFHPNGKLASSCPYEGGEPELPPRSVAGADAIFDEMRAARGGSYVVHMDDERRDADREKGTASGCGVGGNSGLKHGQELHYFEDGTLQGEGRYEKGTAVGRHWQLHTSTQIAFQAKYDESGNLLEPIQEFHESGHLKAVYTLKDEKLEGEYREWFEDGQLHCHYNYADGKLEGEQLEYNEAGTLITRSNFRAGQWEGLREGWHPGGQVAMRSRYRAGTEVESLVWYSDGQKARERTAEVVKEWEPNGQLVLETHYVDGQPDGEMRRWFADGTPRAIYHFEKGQPAGEHLDYFHGGQVARRSQFKNGLLEGQQLNYFAGVHVQGVGRPSTCGGRTIDDASLLARDAGAPGASGIAVPGDPAQRGELDPPPEHARSSQVQNVATYAAGQLHGLKAAWNEEGTLTEEANYEQGNLDGRFMAIQQDGSQVIFHYKNHRREGPYQLLYPQSEDGERQLAAEATYVSDALEGLAREYRPDGKLASEVPYVAGQRQGTAKTFDELGNCIARVPYEEDQRQGIAEMLYPDGSIQKEIVYRDDLKEGPEKTFAPSGDLMALYNYAAGELDGVCSEWDDEGDLMFEGEYCSGLRHGKLNKYYEDGTPRVMQSFVDDKLHGPKLNYDREGNVTETLYEMGRRVLAQAG